MERYCENKREENRWTRKRNKVSVYGIGTLGGQPSQDIGTHALVVGQRGIHC